MEEKFKQGLDELFKNKFSEHLEKGGSQFIEGLAKLVQKREREREADKRYREAHKEELRRKSRERYEANKEMMRIRNAEYKRKERERKKLLPTATE
jgi:hypothetical protein